MQNSFFLQRPTLYFLCTLQSPLTLHQTHSNFSCFVSVVGHFPQTRNSAALLFLDVPHWSYLSSLRGLWQSRCNVPGVLLIVQLCLLFWSCWPFLSLVCILCVFFFLKPVRTFISLFFKKKNSLPSLNLCQCGKPKLVPHICSRWAGALRRPDSVTAGRQNQSEGTGLKHFRDLLVWISRIWVNLWVCSALLVYSELWSLVEPNCDWLCQAEAEFSACHCFLRGEKGELVEGK